MRESNFGIDYPAATFSKSGHVNFALNYGELTTCGQKEANSEWWRGMLIVDSAGAGYIADGVADARGKGKFWGFSLMRQRAMQVDLILNPEVRSIPLAELKERLRNHIMKERFFYNEAWDLKKLLKYIQEAATHEELIRLFMRDQGEF
jgi:hypothetical protein